MLCPVLVGREAELASLEAILAEVVTLSGRLALVGGDAGIGKSRLLDALPGCSAGGNGKSPRW